MAERKWSKDREPASRRSASGRWSSAAGARAELGDAAGVDIDAVITRAVVNAVKEVFGAHGNFWQGSRVGLQAQTEEPGKELPGGRRQGDQGERERRECDGQEAEEALAKLQETQRAETEEVHGGQAGAR